MPSGVRARTVREADWEGSVIGIAVRNWRPPQLVGCWDHPAAGERRSSRAAGLRSTIQCKWWGGVDRLWAGAMNGCTQGAGKSKALLPSTRVA